MKMIDKSEASHGAGLIAGVDGGYWFSKNIGMSAGLIYIVKPLVYGAQSNFGFANEEIETSQHAVHPLFTTISLCLRGQQYLRCFSAQAGVILPLSNKITTESNSIDNTSPYASYCRTETTMKFGVGLHGAINFDYPLTKSIFFSSGIAITALSLWVKKTDITTLTINNQDVMHQMKTADQHIVYEQGYVGGNSSEEYTTLPAYQLPYSSISVKVGVGYRF